LSDGVTIEIRGRDTSASVPTHNAGVDSRAFAVRRTIHRWIRKGGYDLVRYDAGRFPELRRLELIRGRRIDVVLDVGANDGPFAKALRAAGYTGRIVSFEPQSEAFGRLSAAAAADPAWTGHRLALGATDGEAELHLAGNSSSSSLLEMSAQHLASAPESRYQGSESVPVARLDTLRAELVGAGDRVYLKVDTQGYELEVLRGAAGTLPQVDVVDVELSLVPLYDGAPLFDEVMHHLAGHGFVPVSLEPAFTDPADGRLLQLDGLFVRPATGP
jgi:FkbM family methyltransferase